MRANIKKRLAALEAVSRTNTILSKEATDKALHERTPLPDNTVMHGGMMTAAHFNAVMAPL